jgi:uncharacterized protein with FMN-binding domain
MKKIVITAVVIIAFVAYTLYTRSTTSVAPAPVNDTRKETGAAAPTTKTTTTNPSQASGKYKNGEYTGPVTDAIYGPMQVKILVQDGKLSDVEFLQYPNDKPETLKISNDVMPVLKEEAIKAQTAEVDNITGATQTVDGFKQSLAAALAQAE